MAKKTPVADAAPVAAAAPAAPVKAEKPKAEKVKVKAEKKVEATPVAAVTPVAAAVEEAVAVAVVAPAGASVTLAALVEQIHAIDAFLKPIKALIKTLTKEVGKLEKKSEKLDRKRSNAKKVPSGFAKPSPLSEELITFFELPVGTELARTQVTSLVTKYIKEHNLQQESDRRIILPDEPLKKLLRIKEGDKLSYFTLQSYLRVHFTPAVPAAPKV